MNIFDNIVQSQFNKFTGSKPTTPSFSTPIAPRTMNYDSQVNTPTPQPNTQPVPTGGVSGATMGATQTPITKVTAKKPLTLFSNEKKTYDKMLADGLSEDEAQNLVKEHRKKLYPNIDLNPVEVAALRQMANDGLTSYEAAELLKKSKAQKKVKAGEDFQKKYEQGNLLQKGAYNTLAFAAGNLETIAKYGGNILDFATGGQAGFGEDVKAMEQVTQSPEFSDSTAFKAGTYAPDVAMAVAPVGGVATAGTLGKSIIQGVKIGATYGGVNPILQKGSDATAMDIGKGALIGGAVGGAIPIAGKVLSKGGDLIKKSGKALYKTAIKPNAQEARQIIQATAKGKELPVTRADTALKYGITGTEKGIGVKGVRESDKIFKKTINPAMAKSKAEHSLDDLFTRAEQQIAGEKSALRKKELMDGLAALKEDYLATGKKTFTTADLQAEKSMLDEFTPTKVFQGKEVAQGYNQVKNTLANIMREQVRDDLGKVGVKNAKELYRDYANLSALEDVGVKGITESGLKGGFGTFWSTVYDKIATPVKTVGGKYIYKLGNGIEYVGPKGMDTLGKYLKSKGYKVVGGNIINLSKNANIPLIRGTVLSSSPDAGMDRTIVKPKKIN